MSVDFTDNFEIKHLGVIEDDVYDIEVEDNHNFFGNDICVHNSIYVCFDDVVKKKFGSDPDPVAVVKWLDKLCSEVMEPFIERSYQELADHMHAYEQCMRMKREAIADAAFWTGKKRYAMNVWNSEGVQYEHPKVKIVGLEAIKSSTPTVCRDAIKEAIRVVLCEEESDLHRYVERFREEFDGSDVMGVAFPRGVTRVDGYTDRVGNFVKGTPIHVKAAVCYNRLLERHDLVGPYEKIGNGDKFKFHYLRQPNPFGSNVIGCVDSMPEEFNVEPYLDRDLQFEKAFVQPVTTILNAVGWTIEEKSTLEDFFA